MGLKAFNEVRIESYTVHPALWIDLGSQIPNLKLHFCKLNTLDGLVLQDENRRIQIIK